MCILYRKCQQFNVQVDDDANRTHESAAAKTGGASCVVAGDQ